MSERSPPQHELAQHYPSNQTVMRNTFPPIPIVAARIMDSFYFYFPVAHLSLTSFRVMFVNGPGLFRAFYLKRRAYRRRPIPSSQFGRFGYLNDGPWRSIIAFAMTLTVLCGEAIASS